MKLSNDQISQLVSFIDLRDIKSFIEQDPIEYEKFLISERNVCH